MFPSLSNSALLLMVPLVDKSRAMTMMWIIRFSVISLFRSFLHFDQSLYLPFCVRSLCALALGGISSFDFIKQPTRKVDVNFCICWWQRWNICFVWHNKKLFAIVTTFVFFLFSSLFLNSLYVQQAYESRLYINFAKCKNLIFVCANI